MHGMRASISIALGKKKKQMNVSFNILIFHYYYYECFCYCFFSSLCFITISFSLVAPFEAFVSVRRCVFVCDRNVRRSNEVVYMLEIGLIICKMQM